MFVQYSPSRLGRRKKNAAESEEEDEDDEDDEDDTHLPLAAPVFQDPEEESETPKRRYNLTVKGTKPKLTKGKGKMPSVPTGVYLFSADVPSESEDEEIPPGQ